MFCKNDSTDYKTQFAGVEFRTLVYGRNASMHEFKLEKGSKIPVHSHPHEQTGYLISGKMNFIMNDEIIPMEPGDSWNIPGGEEHGADIIENSIVIEIFSPVREEYLESHGK